jgi:head-tail adaptor
MSLLQEAMESCILLNKQTTLDDYGGFVNTWVDGASFDAAITFDTSIEARAAQAQGVHSLYTVTTPRNVVLQYHDIFRRARDNKLFRVTSDGDDKYTPQSTALDMRQVTAEEISVLP